MDENDQLEEGTFEDDISGESLPTEDTGIILPETDEPFDAGDMHQTTFLPGMYQNWFLDYASYVILDRAVPEVLDGLKPVQRRILHSMWELEDGRYNKVANVIGNTMKYHPHGDASIGDAMVQIGQKDLLIDTQGNWGNILTGDRAAAPRYIEARLSKFALEVAFNPKTTKWKLSYDGRNKEPVNLPMKFPVLLQMGVEGIAVGLASKTLPHNFVELIDASIAVLRGQDFILVPDFPTGGLADVVRYNDGLRGGKIRIRARISQFDKKTLVITEIPWGTTTGDLIDTIIAASEKGKIKIRKIDDNTAQNVEILIHLQPGVSPDQSIDALYAFTDCERSESPNSCVIHQGKPYFMGVKDILRISVQRTVEMIRMEQMIREQELMESLLFASLERIFIENRIYHDIEECTTWEEVLSAIDKGLEPYKPDFYREITEEDLIRLTEIRIKRISKFNAFKADEHIKNLNEELLQVKHNLEHLTEFVISFYETIRRKYAAGRERKTELRNFESIEASAVAAATQKLYVNREEGFAGFGLKKDEFVCDCSDIDDIIVFREDGTFAVTRVAEKAFVGKNVIHIDVFKKNDDRTVYHVVYQDGRMGSVYVKRFAVTGVVRDKDYVLTKGTAGSKVLYFTVNPNGESEIIKVSLKPKPRLKKLNFDFDFSELAIKGRSSQGNVLSKNPVKKIVQAEKGFSTLGARHIWYDDTVMRLNTDQRGQYIGAFKEDDKILTLTLSGFYKLMSFDLSNHFEEDMSHIEKFNPSKALTVLYYNELKKASFIKRFIPEFSDKKVCMFPEEDGNKFVKVVTDKRPQIRVEYNNEGAKKPVEPEEIILDEFVEVMGVKAKGKKLSNHPVSAITWLDPIPVEEEDIEEEIEEEIEEDAEEEIDESEDKNEEENEEESIAEIGIKSEESDDTVADEVDWIEESQQANEPIELKEQKKPKEPKVPKVPKESKSIKEPKEPKATKAVQEIKEPKAPIPPVNPPDFPEDDDSGTGIQMSLF
jgi:topoisomerase-4 subunit A